MTNTAIQNPKSKIQNHRVQLHDILLQSSEAALALQAPNGSFPAGWNGPYHDPETPVRNTAHWLVSLLKAYSISGDVRLKDAASRAATYLASAEARPMRATFFCRTNPEKDFCNGLIGQAWTIEALVIAAKALEERQYLELAREVFLLHPFNQGTGLWRCVNVDGSYTIVDMTLNHQLLFAASGAMIESDPQGSVGVQVWRFLDKVLLSHMRVDASGRIIHFIPSTRKSNPLRRLASHVMAPVRSKLRPNTYMIHKEIGYHAFNLYALSILRQHMPTHPLWASEKLLATLRFTDQTTYVHGLEKNKYGYPYNPPGFEVALAMETFSPLFAGSRPAAWWVEQQLRHCYDAGARLMNRATEDQQTLAARLYEATRLQNMELQLGA